MYNIIKLTKIQGEKDQIVGDKDLKDNIKESIKSKGIKACL